jgi:hypothetical protein
MSTAGELGRLAAIACSSSAYASEHALAESWEGESSPARVIAGELVIVQGSRSVVLAASYPV